MARGRTAAHIANPGLRAARERRAWTEDDAAVGLQDLSIELGEPEPAVSGSMFSKWERGVRNPGRFYRPRLCLLFEAMPQEIGLLPNPRLLRDIGELAQRRLDRQQSGATPPEPTLNWTRGTPSAVPASAFPDVDAERMAAVMRYLWPVDDPLLDGLERASRHLDLRADLEPPKVVLPDLMTFLAGIEHLLTRPQGDAAPKLKTIAARAAHHVGYLSFYEERPTWAFNYMAVSEVLAREAGNDLELATTLVGKNGMYLPGDMATAIQVTETARLLLNPAAPSGLIAWISGERAMQEAQLGHEVQAHRYLEATLAAAAADPSALNLFAPDMPPTWLDRRPALVALKLGRTLEALSLLEETYSRIDPRFVREVVLSLIDQATARAMRGDLEQACALLTQAVSLAASTGNLRAIGLARQARERELHRWANEPCVKELDEAIRAARRRLTGG
jgi:hypothetical protein